MRKLLLLAAVAGAVAAALRRQRELELDEAIWEEYGEAQGASDTGP